MLPKSSDDTLLSALIAALPLIARSTGGSGLVADQDGVRIMTVDHEGRELGAEKGMVHALCRKASLTGQPLLGSAERHPGADAWALPLGKYVLAASNGDRMARESELRSSLQSALPLIAKVAGGEALIFDRHGRNLMSVMPDGTSDPSSMGVISPMSRQVMETSRPNISPLDLASGAIAVRIPITREFGLGFSNAGAALRSQKAAGEVQHRKTARYSWADLITQSPAMKAAVNLATRAASTTSPVWIFGETGTGKELFAQAIHSASARRDSPFVAINCGAMPAPLVESILFGYVDGAFTGARRGGQAGLFEEANGGTLLLDEISELDLLLQVKLLRVLQEREVSRIGSAQSVPVNTRVMCTSNKDLSQMAEAGTFRADLYYRLNVVDIHVPPLRARRGDIPLLTEHFLSIYSHRLGKLVHRIEPAATDRMHEYHWPGNVRELQNCVERVVNLAEADTIRYEHLPSRIRNYVSGGERPITLSDRIRAAERAAILSTIEATGGNRVLAATQLGISPTTMWRKLREHGYEAAERTR